MWARWAVRAITAGLWVLAAALVLLAGSESWLRVREAFPAGPQPDDAALDARFGAYDRCTRLEPHPYYGWFFPLDLSARRAISTDVCTIGADGFRGPGPEARGGRRLAFLTGGSAAFGDQASSDGHTISAYLNTAQSRYFFVNAGVSGWHSTPELIRLELELLQFEPDLVVAFDGWNDAHVRLDVPDYATSIATPLDEYYQAARAFARGRRWPSLAPGPWSVWGAVTPRVAEWLHARYGHRIFRSGPVPGEPERLQAQADRFLANLDLMDERLAARGAKFLAVFQPVASLHRRLDPGAPIWRMPTIEPMHRLVAAAGKAHAWLDLARVFDGEPGPVTVRRDRLDDALIFFDEVHLTDRGNAVVARHIAARIAELDAAGWPARPARPTAR